MIDHSSMKLGKAHARHDARTLALASYITPQLPAPPPSTSWLRKCNPNWPMFLNDEIGDCTCAAAGHLIQAWTTNAQHAEIEVADGAVLAMYEALTGYTPNDPSTDTGATELDALKLWRKQGCGGHKIAAFASVWPRAHGYVRDAIYLLGGLYIGVGLPVSAQRQIVWDVPPGGPSGVGEPWSWGGHCIPIIDYDARGLTCVTWGALKRLTWAFLDVYCDEAYGVLSMDFVHNGRAPNGFDVATLQRDLAAL